MRHVIFLGAIFIACHGRTRVPTQGPVTVSGTCGAETGVSQENTEGYGYSFDESFDIDHASLEVSIEDGHLAIARVEMKDFAGEGTITVIGEIKPRTQLVVGEWIDLDVPLHRVDDVDVVRAARVKMRIVGEEMELGLGTRVIRGPCAWGHAED